MKLRCLRNKVYAIISPEEAREEIEDGSNYIYSITCYLNDAGAYGYTPTVLTRGPSRTNGQTIYAEEIDHPKFSCVARLSEQDFPYFNNVTKHKKVKVENNNTLLEDKMLSLTAHIKNLLKEHEITVLKIEALNEEMAELEVELEDIAKEIDDTMEELLDCKK